MTNNDDDVNDDDNKLWQSIIALMSMIMVLLTVCS